MGDELQIRQIEVDELPGYQAGKMITYLEDPTESVAQARWRRRALVPGRFWCAADGADIVGTLRTMARRLSVPDGAGGTVDIDVDALSGVSVAATHRRRGLLRRMLTESLAAAHDRGDPVSALIAAEWPIYGRFGYWPAGQWASGHLDRRRRGAHLTQSGSGGLRRIDSTQLGAVAPAVFASARTARAGHIDRIPLEWELDTSPELQRPGVPPKVDIVHDGPDGVDGYLRWHPTSSFDFVNGGRVVVDELFATDQHAYSALWGYLLGMDVVDEIAFSARPVDEPLPWLLADGRGWQVTQVIDAMWLRLLDVPAALSARGYATAGRLVLDVVDDDIGHYGTGRFLLEASASGAQCRRAPELTPDVRMSQRALASIYLGQPSLRTQQTIGLVDELSAGAVHRVDLMFGTALLPWLGTEF